MPEPSGNGSLPSSRHAFQTSMTMPSFSDITSRLRERVDDAARGTDVPAGIERGDVTAPTSSRERGRLRRRLRELRRLREAQLLELGALVLEAHKQGRDATQVISAKAADAAATDGEARAIADALGTDAGLDTVIAAGIAGPCPTCATLTSTAARFCSTCGTPLDGRPGAAPPVTPAATTPDEPTAPAPEAGIAPDQPVPVTTEATAPDGPAPLDAGATEPDRTSATGDEATTEVKVEA